MFLDDALDWSVSVRLAIGLAILVRIVLSPANVNGGTTPDLVLVLLAIPSL